MSLYPERSRTACVCLTGVLALVGCSAERESAAGRSESRVNFYAEQTRDFPTHYQAWAELAFACLERAGETHDVSDVIAARAAAERSVEIQENYAGFLALAAVANFAHRFEAATEYLDKAESAAPEPRNERIAAQRAEAYLALGRTAEAAACVDAASNPMGFYASAARGHVLVAEGRTDEAAAAFLTAERAALNDGSTDLAAWARIRTAGVYLDSGRPDEALPHLQQAALLAPESVLLRIHQAEWLESEGRRQEALAAYEDLASATRDPTLHARAHAVAKSLGQERSARRHFEAAEAGLSAPIQAGEVYTLGALAALYLSDGVHLERARELALRNLEYKRDAEAVQLAQMATE